MRLALPLLVLALVALPACDAVESVINSLSQPSQQELDALTSVFGCTVVGIAQNSDRTGRLVGGAVGTGDCRLPEDDSLIDFYAFRVGSETRIRVTMTSSDFAPYLLLFGDNPTELLAQQGPETGDDSVTLTYTLGAGLYVIGANSELPGRTGDYRLRLERN